MGVVGCKPNRTQYSEIFLAAWFYQKIPKVKLWTSDMGWGPGFTPFWNPTNLNLCGGLASNIQIETVNPRDEKLNYWTTLNYLLSGWWFEPLWKIWESIGMIRNPIYGKIKNGNQTTNQKRTGDLSHWNKHRKPYPQKDRSRRNGNVKRNAKTIALDLWSNK